ncbi:MAG TPA: type I DNA topoisomerase [Trueperaceae bacterium]|nr:type I DNA topoisomerase [Trueperaceae bacterium]
MIVESPTKARTISRFLPPGYQVEASMGHVRDLPSSAAEIPDEVRKERWSRLGVNVEEGFKPIYVVSPGKREVVRRLKAALKQADEVYIATDEDREGESIGWHLVEVLEPRVPVRRMVFHEITADAIRGALENTRDIDLDLVDAQETRRVLDRLVGYELSPLLWRKIAPRLSAGRVQSVAVRLLVMRERERLDFVAAQYWDLTARLASRGAPFTAELTHVAADRVAQGRDFDPATGRLRAGAKGVVLLGEAAARSLASAAEDAAWRVLEVEEKEQSRSPAPPFTTSTLQQEASRKLGLSARETMRVAQSLYENGYITYMRTDSVHLSTEALTAARDAISRRYGAEYLPDGPRRYRQRARGAQEAHEAIRPAGTQMRTADEHGLRGVEARLYDLIWKRTVASQMKEARLKLVTARVEARLGDAAPLAAALGGELPAGQEPTLGFRAAGRTVVFPGFFRAYVEGSDDPEAALDDRDQPLPPLAQGAALDCLAVEAAGHETKPPARYTDASLVKVLEAEGIGRPSTYASIIDTIQTRGYARKVGQQLVPTFTAFATTALLERQFRRLVDTEFTAGMESVLDDIAAGERPSDTYLRDFYLGDEGIVKRVEQAMEDIDARAISTVTAAKWEPYVVRVGRYGPYVEGELDGELKTASLPGDVAPADLTREDLERYLREGNLGDVEVATEPETGEPVLLKRGPFGPYLQLGRGEGAEKPKRVSLPPGVEPHDVSPEMALRLIALPSPLGEHPEGGTVDVGIGRFGPYVRHGRTYASIPKDRFVLDVTLPEALELLQKKTARGGGALRELGVDERTGEVVDVREGRYGPYVKRGKLNASLPKDVSPEEVTLEQALALLDARAAAAAAKGGAGAKRGRGAGAKKAASGKGAARSGTAKKATGGKKATSKTRTVKGATRRTNARKTKTA